MSRRGGVDFNVEWEGIVEMSRSLGNMEQRFMAILVQEMTAYGMLVEEGAKALAPHDEGDLEDSINFGQARRMGNSVVVEGGANTPYAMLQHEKPAGGRTNPKYDNGSKFPAYYSGGRGARTRSKGGWRGYIAGRKYLFNAVKATEHDWNQMLDRVLERVIRESGFL